MTARVTLAIAWAVLAAALFLMFTAGGDSTGWQPPRPGGPNWTEPENCWTPATDDDPTIYQPETP